MRLYEDKHFHENTFGKILDVLHQKSWRYARSTCARPKLRSTRGLPEVRGVESEAALQEGGLSSHLGINASGGGIHLAYMYLLTSIWVLCYAGFARKLVGWSESRYPAREEVTDVHNLNKL
jgi:hypothetical protein